MQAMQEPPAKQMRTSDGSAASMRHIQTEKRRRDRINDGYTALRELIPSKDKADKATVLMQVVEYIRQIQTVIQQVLAHAPNGQLPEELQWSMRMLLPREGAQAGFASAGNSGQLAAAPSQNAAAPTPVSAAPQVAFATGQAAAAAGQGYTPQQIAMMQLGQQGLAEGYPPNSQAVSVNDANLTQLSALFPQVPHAQQNAMNQNQMMQLLQLSMLQQAQQHGNGQHANMAGVQDALRQYQQQQQMAGQVVGTPAGPPPASPQNLGDDAQVNDQLKAEGEHDQDVGP